MRFRLPNRFRLKGATPYGLFSASENGVLAYQTGTAAAGSQLVWFDRTGKKIGVLGDSALYTDLELSPDGKRASVSLPGTGGPRDIWLYDLARGLPTRFTFGQDALTSIWSPDGSRIVFNSTARGIWTCIRRPPAGLVLRKCCSRTISTSSRELVSRRPVYSLFPSVLRQATICLSFRFLEIESRFRF